jgi:SAM-dependent MidA family methyltransferase
VTEIEEIIAGEIRAHGPVSFARFMDLALYAPGLGYYERALDQIGRRGDFYTSVSVGTLFGELLAFQFARWLGELPAGADALQIVEAGAHNGQLAADILAALSQHEPGLAARMEYIIVEPSVARRAAQQNALAGMKTVRWVPSLARLERPVRGVIFSNELLDAFPVRLFAWNAAARRWDEMGVNLVDGAFGWSRLVDSSATAPEFPDALLDVLPDGYVVETCPAATQWWRDAAAALGQGRLMTIDYGGTFEELLNPARTRGTVRAYSRHHANADVLTAPGGQDITAHVNFTDIRRAGESAGLRTELFTDQSRFLTELARDLWTARRVWPPAQVRQFQTLTHPEHLGRPFRVLVQSR